MKIKGKVTYIDLEGGFWGIKGEDGKDYLPAPPLPKGFQKEGMTIFADAEPAGGFSLFMWGTSVKLTNLSSL